MRTISKAGAASRHLSPALVIASTAIGQLALGWALARAARRAEDVEHD